MLVISAHKFGGPRGLGGVLIRNADFNAFTSGGQQEWQLRAGTENLAGLAAALKALEFSINEISKQKERLNQLKAELLKNISELNFSINTPEESLPGFISLCFPGHIGNEIVSALSLDGFSISSGSACHANQQEPSRIILALGKSQDEANGNIRITMGRGTTAEATDELADALIKYLRK